MDSGRKKDEAIEKLDVIWRKVSRSNVSGFQNIILRHILGEKQDGIDIKMVSYLTDSPHATPDKLYSYLVGGLRKLITYAYIGVEKDSILRQEYEDKVKRLQAELDNKDRLIEEYRNQRPAHQIKIKREVEYVVDNEEITRLENELRTVKAQRDDWKNRYYELKGHNSDIDLSKYVDMGLYTETLSENSKLQQANSTLLSEKSKQQSDITSLKGQLADTSTQLKDLKKYEKKVLPILRKSAYQQQYQGKCITLEPSQIETIVRKYLNGLSPYKISKEMGISKTSINMIVRCEYKAEQSLDKILKALHQVNKEGNWGGEKQDKLNGLIQVYESSLSTVRALNKIKNKEIKDGIQSLEDYVSWVEDKNDYSDYIEDTEC